MAEDGRIEDGNAVSSSKFQVSGGLRPFDSLYLIYFIGARSLRHMVQGPVDRVELICALT